MARTPILSIIRRHTAVRFWKRVKGYDPYLCWDFQGHVVASGYGVLQISYNYKRERYSVLAHRLAWVLHHRMEIPDDRIICHHCDNRLCCNPAHLYLGTPASNLRDAMRRGRWKKPRAPMTGVKGEKHPASKYSDAQRVQAVEMRSKGQAFGAIEQALSIPRRTVALWWREYVKTLRPRSLPRRITPRVRLRPVGVAARARG